MYVKIKYLYTINLIYELYFVNIFLFISSKFNHIETRINYQFSPWVIWKLIV